MLCPNCGSELSTIDNEVYVCLNCGMKIYSDNSPVQETEYSEYEDKNFADNKYSNYLASMIILFVINLIFTFVLAFCKLSLIGVVFLTIFSVIVSLAYTICLIKAIVYHCLTEYDNIKTSQLTKTYTKYIKKLKSKVNALEKRVVNLESLSENQQPPIDDNDQN